MSTMLKMVVDSDHLPDIIQPGRAAQLCRELELAGVDVVSPVNSDGVLTSGVALRIDAWAVQDSGAAAAHLREQAFDALANGLPLSVTVSGLTADPGSVEIYSNLCEQLRLVRDNTAASSMVMEVAIDSESFSPHVAWLMRRKQLGFGPLFLLPAVAQMQPARSHKQRRHHDRFWLQLWNLRTTGMLRAAFAPLVRSQCPLLSAEMARAVAPATSIQVPAGSAWVSMRLDVSRFADDDGSIHEGLLEQTLRRSVEIGDELHGLMTWPSAQMAHDAWLNRRLAIMLTGIGDLAQKRDLDPRRFASLENLCGLLGEIQTIVRAHSRQIARRTDYLPALARSDPSHGLPGGQVQSGWRRRWRDAVEIAAVRHRNLVVISPWSIFPTRGPADFRYTDLLPLLQFADACAFPEPPELSDWNINEFKSFHQRAWAVLQQRDTEHQIAERP